MSIFNAIPGLEMPIHQVTDTLAKMWQNEPIETNNRPSFIHSCQLNLILHNGLFASKHAALEGFNCAIEFSKKYPCRIVILCPEQSEGLTPRLKGKLFSECFFDNGIHQEYYCEALVLGYTTDDTPFLTDQVSLWLENDLPTYYWVNQISPSAIKKHYLTLSSLCSKVIYDSHVEPEEFENIHWPNSQPISDLALMRLLPIRQSLGQFFSNYSPKSLVENLKNLVVQYNPNDLAEAQRLLEWFKKALIQSAQLANTPFNAQLTLVESPNSSNSLETHWRYSNNNAFDWTYNSESGISEINASFNNQTIAYPLRLRQISPEESLAAAIFY